MLPHPIEATALRYNNLSLMAAEMNSEGSKTEERYSYLSKEIDRIIKELKNMDSEKQPETKEQSNGSTNINNSQTNSIIILKDPDIAATKGRPSKSNKRKKPIAEQMRSGKKKYNCQKCNGSGHNTATCTATTQAKGKAGAATAKYKKKQHKQGKYSCRRNRMKLQKNMVELINS